MLTALLDNARHQFDLTEKSSHEHLQTLVTQLLESEIPTCDLKEAARNAPLEFRLAEKLVDSRRYLQAVTQPLKIGVVFAMWGEQNRLYPKRQDNPNGEDSLRVKLAQLAWATADTPIEWTLYAVDDGDPNESGRIAQEIAATHPHGEQVRVLHLAEAVPTGSGPLARLESAEKSRKGGAIIYGCMQAIADGADVIIYTDADNSVHLGQIGLLLCPYLTTDVKVVLGNRKHPESVLVKQEGRWGIGIKLLRHMQRMIGKPIFSLGIRDTQAAFKLYDANLLADIIADPTVYDFSFDTDWIMAVIKREQPFTTVPFAFIDSAAESASITQGPMTTWETLLHGLKAAVRKHDLPHEVEMARVLDEEIESSADLDLLINRLPDQLAMATDAQLGDPAIMSPAEVQAWIQQCKQEAE